MALNFTVRKNELSTVKEGSWSFGKQCMQKRGQDYLRSNNTRMTLLESPISRVARRLQIICRQVHQRINISYNDERNSDNDSHSLPC